MDSSVMWLIVSLIALIGMSAFFSASETAISSANRIRIKNYSEDGNKKAGKVLRLIDDFDKTLSGILIGNNVVNIASASIGTSIAITFFGPAGVGISTVVMTVLVLIFGEILPKSHAKEHSDKVALSFAPALSVIVKLLSPLSYVFSGIKGIITKPAEDEEKKPSITEEELKYIIEEIQDEGVLEEQESELAQSALEFDEIKVGEILTPRVDVAALDISMSIQEMQDIILEEKYTRLPVYEDTVDNIIGILHERDFLSALVRRETADVRSLMNDAVFLPDNLKISKALAQMQKEKVQMAVVTDQYGGTAGIVTMEDILEELVGEIWDEHDEVLQLIEPLSPTVFRVNGNLDLDDLLEEIGYEGDDIESRYNSVGGWASEVLGKIPTPGESFEYNNLKVTIDEVEDNRVSQLTVEYIAD